MNLLIRGTTNLKTNHLVTDDAEFYFWIINRHFLVIHTLHNKDSPCQDCVDLHNYIPREKNEKGNHYLFRILNLLQEYGASKNL